MKKNLTSWLCKAAALLAVASTAQAVNTDALRYSLNGGSWVTVTDGGAGDVNPGNNSISVFILGGGFNLVLTSGFESGLTPSSNPNMDLHVSGTTTGAGTIVIEYSDIGFSPIPAGGYSTSFFNNSPGVVGSERTIVGGNTLFAGGDLPLTGGIGVIGPFDVGSGNSAGAVPGQSDPYSITLATSLTSTSAGGSISSDAHLTVPDGGNTLMLLGSALSVLGFVAFRNSRKSADVKA